MADAQITNPVINSPYEPPSRHFVIGDDGHPRDETAPGRRPSQSFIPIAPERKAKGKAAQQTLDFGTGERIEENTLINSIRRDVAKWRMSGHYDGVTPISRKLLQHWADPSRDNRVLFCQREAVETAIFLAEVAGRHGYTDWRRRLDPVNDEYNSGLPRIAMKMATGSGKTVVMAMLIAWQTLNKVQTPRDARFTTKFLVVTPGITIRDRLRVLQPSDPGNYYKLRDLIPADLEGMLDRAQVVVTNYHAFLPREAKEFKGVAANTKKLLRPGESAAVFKESEEQVVARVLRDFGSAKGEVVVLNDEAHHCYQDKVMTSSEVTKEEAEANVEARVWFKGVLAVAKRVGVKQVFDLSATPYFLSGSGHHQGTLFGWTVSDFSLMDAIESGIVKIPRTPVDDDAAGDQVSYLHLWDQIGDKLPKRKGLKLTLDQWPLPEVLEGALQSLYSSYQKSYDHWQRELAPFGETPPVFIVVCPNTSVSKLVFEWIGGWEAERDGMVVPQPGRLALFDNYPGGRALARPRTILVDSAQLESGEGLKDDFKKVAGPEIAAFKAQYRIDHPGADVDKITDEEILREVMNTVGKPGMLGADVRCVVSVAMLTEGWDANTVSHILGVRAFGSQLLCEQVVGRGLRRRSYVVDDDGLFAPEYANVYGIPFSFIPTDTPTTDPKPPQPTLHVHAVPGREDLEIQFPWVDGYRLELPDPELHFEVSGAEKFVIGASEVPTWTVSAGVVGVPERDEMGDRTAVRDKEIAFALAKDLLENHYQSVDDRRPWLFPQLVDIAAKWLRECVVEEDGRTAAALLSLSELRARACEQIVNLISTYPGSPRARVRVLLRAFDPVGTSADVSFFTRKAAIEAEKSQVSHCVLDGQGGNTWEQIMAQQCELNGRVAAWVKNDHLGFEIPYVHNGRSHAYVPDFILRLAKADDDVDRHLIVEVSGGQKSPGPTKEKAETARNRWCQGVNNRGGFGIWDYIEITDPTTVPRVLNDAIDRLYRGLLSGDPDRLDSLESLIGGDL
ncbi:MAG: DEAD/DEAH box helicase family protein [Gordonia sp. (in: high G+C Gram-positive bacteria)]|uniref:BPTD_3080 family restriction endonuclease n=1 Tax=Gordonia sp. (in: high G+C Gram-positive bacteria) TaxID=84139 RepID=UPI0039E4951C